MSPSSREMFASTIIFFLFEYFLSICYEPGTDKRRIVFF